MSRTPISAIDNLAGDGKLINPNSLTRSPVVLAVRCKHCIHFRAQRSQYFSDVCAKLGVLEAARPCQHFKVDANSFGIETAEGAKFAEFIGQLPTAKLASYAALFTQERTTRRVGYRHGELVYVHVYPGDYLSNYARATVIMADRNHVFVQGNKRRFRGVLMRATIFKVEQFEQKRKVLRARRRFVDPELRKYTGWRPPRSLDILKTMEQPTIDELTAGNFPIAGKAKPPPRKLSRRSDLTKILV
jgi:hypothetical protein